MPGRLEQDLAGVLGVGAPTTIPIERLAAAGTLANPLVGQGQYFEADMQREVLPVIKRVLGAEDPNTHAIATNLATSLSYQGKYADAEEIEREVLALKKRELGTEHPDTLITAGNLALSISFQEKHAEAEQIQREVLAVMTRVLGAEHPDTLIAASNLAYCLQLPEQRKHTEECVQGATGKAGRG